MIRTLTARPGPVDVRPRRRHTQRPEALGIRELSDEDVDAIAKRLADVFINQQAQAVLIDASEVARRFGLSRAWVYANAHKLGAIRVGHGPRARMRFDAERVVERLAGMPGIDATPALVPHGKSRRPKAPAPLADAELLPIDASRGPFGRTSRTGRGGRSR